MTPTETTAEAPERADMWKVVLRCRCPRCGDGPLLKGYLSVRESCPACGLDFGFADPADGPAFFVMSIVGVLGMIALMALELGVHPPIWVHLLVTLPLILILSLGSLRPFKAWLVAEQYARKAAPPEFSSIGGHGEGSRWRERRR
ncbi:DUF983 domain-containing protein [Brevundimonas sp. A19_0]|uniref:DUF983 domain-containing protein n=1 Tax=Brevundimonas sp. A19_0 TaxID=2821087 RepID=UPI0032AF3678